MLNFLKFGYIIVCITELKGGRLMISVLRINESIRQHKRELALGTFLLGASFGIVGCSHKENTPRTSNFRNSDLLISEKTVPPQVVEIVNSKHSSIENKVASLFTSKIDKEDAEGIATKAILEKLTHEVANNPKISTTDLNRSADKIIDEGSKSTYLKNDLENINGLIIGSSYGIEGCTDEYSDNVTRELYDTTIPKRVVNIVESKKDAIDFDLDLMDNNIPPLCEYPLNNKQSAKDLINYTLKECLTHKLAKNPNISDSELNLIADKFISDTCKIMKANMSTCSDGTGSIEISDVEKEISVLISAK